MVIKKRDAFHERKGVVKEAEGRPFARHRPSADSRSNCARMQIGNEISSDGTAAWRSLSHTHPGANAAAAAGYRSD